MLTRKQLQKSARHQQQYGGNEGTCFGTADLTRLRDNIIFPDPPKPKVKTFDYIPFHIWLHNPPMEMLPRDVETIYPPSEIKTRNPKGKIILFQGKAEYGQYGVVVGWVLSKPRKLPKREGMVRIKVLPLTKVEQGQYRSRLRKLLKGVLRFW